MAKILLVEDEPELAKMMASWLSRDEHLVKIFQHGDEALLEIKEAKERYELLIMDITLPGRDGFEICKFYRNHKGNAPVLVVSARGSISDKEQAFNLGADDYITKPFDLKELNLRVKALLRRSVLTDQEVIGIRDIRLNTADCSVTKSGLSVHLTPQEFYLLMFFLRNPNQVFSSDDLLRLVWGPTTCAMNDTVRGHVKRLRQKLETKGEPTLISNVYGFGYKLNGQITNAEQECHQL
jgi:DNA-binding response OmpR family regulator